MASVIYSGVGITDMAGSIGGTVQQRNANGAFSRNKPIPTQPNTSYQTDQRAIFLEVVGTWRDLSQARQDAWIAFAATSAGEYTNRLGVVSNYTGQQLFIKLNLAAYTTSFPIEDPPTQRAITPFAITAFTVEVDAGALITFDVTFDNVIATFTPSAKFYATATLSAGINRPRRSLFKLIFETAGSVEGTTVDLTTEYEARFGVPTAGGKIFILSILTDPASGYELTNAQEVAVVVEL